MNEIFQSIKHDLFGQAPAPDPLIGRAICMDQTCACGTNVALVYAGRGPHAAELRCRNCDRHWQWLSHIDFQTLGAVVAKITDLIGAPVEIKYSMIKQRRQTMSDQQYDDTNRGALFRNADKVKDAERDYSGTLNVNGEEFWVSGWLKTSKKGTKYLSISIKPKTDVKPSAPKKPLADDMSDSIPF